MLLKIIHILQDVLKRMKQRPKFVALDTMNFWMDIAWNDLMEVLKEVPDKLYSAAIVFESSTIWMLALEIFDPVLMSVIVPSTLPDCA